MEAVLSGVKNIHLVGIGGVGMSGLALLLKDKGFDVSGSDIKGGSNVRMLQKRGIKVFIGHRRNHVGANVQILGYSSAVKKDNPEILQARKIGIRILQRGEFLAWLCRGRKIIAVAGSHGKTTTTSLIGHILTVLDYNPAVFLGGLPLNYSRGAWWGDDYFVIETDESDGSFLYYEPWVSIITNVDAEHLDYFRNFQNLQKNFQKFAGRTKDKVFGWGDDPFLAQVISENGGITFGWKKNNLIRGQNLSFQGLKSYFDLYVKGKFTVRVKTPLLGQHNCLNTLAAFAFCYYLGEDLNRVNRALKDFKGTERRFQVKTKVNGVTFIDDYAHHPTEISAVIKAARLLNPRRILVVFQPHRFSRVKRLYREFLHCFEGADEVVITDIYSASEENQNNIQAKKLCEDAVRTGRRYVRYVGRNALARVIPALLQNGGLVLIMGAGDINVLMDGVINEFRKN